MYEYCMGCLMSESWKKKRICFFLTHPLLYTEFCVLLLGYADLRLMSVIVD